MSARVELVGDPGAARVLAELLERDANGRDERTLDGVELHCKWGPLRARSAARHAARAVLLRTPPPRLAEHANLHWLRAHGFDAPRPVAAGCLWRLGLPRAQFLATETLQDALTLRALLTGDAAPAERASAVDALARESARLHAQGFVHRDLFPRNLLVLRGGDASRIAFLDAWRGGPRRGLRGPDYDLGCLFVFAAELFSVEEQRAFLQRYLTTSAAEGRTLERAALLASVARHRAREAARFLRRRRRESELAPPPREWDVAALA